MESTKLVYDIWLSCALTPDTPTFKELLSVFSDCEAIYAASESELKGAGELKPSEIERLMNKDLTRAEEIFTFCRERGVGMLSYFDEAFPQALRDIPTPPVLLYYRGRVPDFDKSFSVAVVGTRAVSSYGRKNAFNIAHDLARSGAIVVSGMALGIDGVAHAGALSAGGVTVAVIGSGIDVCYPLSHKTLAREIVKTGCVFTEYAPGTRPDRYNFPRRNRIISGLCAATVVIEGRENSGSLLTARHAMKQGRTVYALPGSVDSKNSEASIVLLKNGAKALSAADDVVRDFEPLYQGLINPFKLAEETQVSMTDELVRYAVCATAQDDDIFAPKRPKRKTKAEKTATSDIQGEENAPIKKRDDKSAERKEEQRAPDPKGFDKTTLGIYKLIPLNAPCSIESLVSEEHSLREVMKAILKLEMSRFVTVLPGERVARNLK